MPFTFWSHPIFYTKNGENLKWHENAKNLTEPYNGHFKNLTEPYNKENKTLQNLTPYLSQVVVTLELAMNVQPKFLNFERKTITLTNQLLFLGTHN